MKRVTINRYAYLRGCTLGKLSFDDFDCYTLERPWRDNEVNVSAIPDGTYTAKRRHSEKYGHHWILEDVPGRSLILIHIGNYPKDSKGCILVGTYAGDGRPAVWQSRVTMNKLRVLLPDEFEIVISAGGTG